MNQKRIVKWLTGLILAAMVFVGFGATVAEATNNAGPLTDVVITKVETPDEAKDMNIDQLKDGVDVATYFTDGKVIPGVSFTYFNVSEAHLNIMKNNPGAYDTVAEVSALVGNNGTATADTDVNGQVTIPALPEGHYWIVENTKGTIASSTAVPFALTLPFTNKAGTGYLNKIYVYPKNTLQGVPMDGDLVKKVISGDELLDHKDFNYGDVVTWEIKVAIPEGIEDYTEFQVFDDDVEHLEYLGNVVVSAGNPMIEHDGGRLIVDFENSLAALSNVDFVTIRFNVKFLDTVRPDELLENTATLVFDNGHGKDGYLHDKASVITGGEKFIKVDGQKGLEGAEFYIRKGNDYLNTDGGVVTFGPKADATKFISDDNGHFSVEGLAYGDYVLEEIKAPEGYALPTNPDTAFTVQLNSWTEHKINIVNKKVTIPQTGGFGTMAFTVIGSILMLFAVGYYRKTSDA